MKPWARRQIGARAKAKRPRRTPGSMNKTEAAYASHLAAKKLGGEILDYAFEPVKLRLANSTFFTPDFLVLLPDLTLEFHEVKACKANGAFLTEDDAMVKLKVAAEMHWMFTFRLCGKLAKNQGWRIDEIPN